MKCNIMSLHKSGAFTIRDVVSFIAFLQTKNVRVSFLRCNARRKSLHNGYYENTYRAKFHFVHITAVIQAPYTAPCRSKAAAL